MKGGFKEYELQSIRWLPQAAVRTRGHDRIIDRSPSTRPNPWKNRRAPPPLPTVDQFERRDFSHTQRCGRQVRDLLEFLGLAGVGQA